MKTFVLILSILTVAQASNVQLYEHRLYTQEEVSLLNWFELTILRNELYAMQGYIFSNEWLSAYFESQDWYSPSPSFTTAAEFPIEFTNEQQANIDLFLSAAEGLGGSILDSYYSETQDLEVEYYRQVLSPTDTLPVPYWYSRLAYTGSRLGGYPDCSEQDLLPFDYFDYHYTGYDRHNDSEAWNATLDSLDQYGVQDKTVYRVYFRPDRTIAKVEKVTIMFLCGASYEPYVVWRAYFPANSNFYILVPDCELERCSWDVTLIYTCSGDECILRAAFKGGPHVTLEIYEGPYSDLPLSIEINNEDIGGLERSEELFPRGYY